MDRVDTVLNTLYVHMRCTKISCVEDVSAVTLRGPGRGSATSRYSCSQMPSRLLGYPVHGLTLLFRNSSIVFDSLGISRLELELLGRYLYKVFTYIVGRIFGMELYNAITMV